MYKKLMQQIDNFRNYSPEILARVELYPDESRDLIAKYELKDTGTILLRYIDSIEPRIHFKSKKGEYYVFLTSGEVEITKRDKVSGVFNRISAENFNKTEQGRFTLENIEKLKNKLLKKNEKFERWLEIKDIFFRIVELHKNEPYKLFQLLADIEVSRTKGRTKQQPVSKTPYADEHYFPNAFQILKSFIKSATNSDSAAKYWERWLIRETVRLNKYGPRSLDGHNIKKRHDVEAGEIYQIPNRYYKALRKGEYVLTELLMSTSKYDAVRQQMHILESISYYGGDIKETISDLRKLSDELKGLKEKKKEKAYFRLKEGQAVLLLEILMFYQGKLEKRKTYEQREALHGVDQLVEYFYAYILKRNIYQERIELILRRIDLVLKYLQKRRLDLSAQYKYILLRRDNIVKTHLLEVCDIVSGKNKDVPLSEALFLLQGILSGYANEETLNKRSLDAKKEFEKLIKFLKALMSLREHLKKSTASYKKTINNSINLILNKLDEVMKIL